MSRRDFDLGYITGELEKLSSKVRSKLEVYVAGGFVMVVNRLKDGTKDVDVVVVSKSQLVSLERALLKSGYKTILKPQLTTIYEQLAAVAILENRDGFRWDIYLRVVANKLFLSTHMKRRAQQYLKRGHLVVYTLSREDVFLMKGLTDRDRDLEDMYRTARSGIDYKVVFDECVSQSEKTRRVWESGLYEKCKDLKAKYNLVVPFTTKLRKLAEEKMLLNGYAREIRKGNNTVDLLVDAFKGKPSRKEVISDLKMLTKMGKLSRRGGRFLVQ